jgi:hypothetical protein
MPCTLHMVLLFQNAEQNRNITKISLCGVTIDRDTFTGLVDLFGKQKWKKITLNICSGQ